jgi:hypothetical protein
MNSAVVNSPGYIMSTMDGNLRKRACAAGLDPAYWYAVEWDAALTREKVIGVRLGKTLVALYRGRDGQVRAVEDRCAHRQTRLSHGFVDGCDLKCIYHGWTYGPDGRLAAIPHELFGRPFPSVQLRTFPVQVRYGLIWVFFGDPSLTGQRDLPEIPELEGDRPWACIPMDFLWRAHPTMIINNAMDSTHVGTLHNRRFQTRSLKMGPVTRCQAEGDRVIVSHDIEMDRTALLWHVANEIKVGKQDACYEYPYLWISVGEVYKLWNFMLPIDEHTTRIFMLSLGERIKIPFTPWLAPPWLVKAFLPLTKRFLTHPLFEEDGWSTEIEQEGYEENGSMPSIDLHPAPNLCYQLTIRKWEEHLARQTKKANV